MNKNRSIMILGWMLSFAVAIPALGEAGPPNILFIMSDDHTTQAIGAYGSRLATLNPTPHIDSLAKGGMRFDRVFCINSICTPSRASIIRGQYSQTNGALDLTGNIPPERQYLPIEMGKAGYHTAMIGKWHLKQEPAAFDYYCVLLGQGRYFNPTFRVRGNQPWPRNTISKDGQHCSDAITEMPFIVHYPDGVRAGSTNDWLINNTDFAATILALAGVETPEYMQGRSFGSPCGASHVQQIGGQQRTTATGCTWLTTCESPRTSASEPSDTS